jgi:small subunit ribosomal protein S1
MQSVFWTNDTMAQLRNAMKNGSILQGLVYKNEKVSLKRSGENIETEMLSIDLGGVEARCSAEEFSAHSFRSLKGFIGLTVDLCVIDILEEEGAKPIAIVSRKKAEEMKAAHIKENIKEGDVVDGVISGFNETNNTIFINIGGLDAFCYLSDWDHLPVQNVRDVGVNGQPVTAVVKRINQDPYFIRVSRKEATKDPWEGVAEEFKVDSDVLGKVTNISQEHGIFVSLKRGVSVLATLPKSYNLPQPVPGIAVRGKLVYLNEQARKGRIIITNYPHGVPTIGNPGAYLFE